MLIILIKIAVVFVTLCLTNSEYIKNSKIIYNHNVVFLAHHLLDIETNRTVTGNDRHFFEKYKVSVHPLFQCGPANACTFLIATVLAGFDTDGLPDWL